MSSQQTSRLSEAGKGIGIGCVVALLGIGALVVWLGSAWLVFKWLGWL